MEYKELGNFQFIYLTYSKTIEIRLYDEKRKMISVGNIAYIY